MSQNNKGSIMIVTLIILSIISTICITCISLTYSNINIASLELKNLQLKQNALGAVEIVYGNIKNEIDNAIDSCSNSQEYINYIKRDNYKSFILNCKDISKSDLDNTTVELTNKTPFGEVKNFEFEMKVFAKENNYKKQVKVNIRIKNPWKEISTLQEDGKIEDESIEDIDTEEVITKINIENNEFNNINEIDIDENYEDEEDDTDSINGDIKTDLEDIKEVFKKYKLITIYNYEEI